MKQQGNGGSSVVTTYQDVPYGIISDEIEAGMKNEYFQEVHEIVGLYDKYKVGQEFTTEGSSGDYIPSQLRYKKAASIVNKEARFLFSQPPSFSVNQDDVSQDESDSNTIIQDFLDKVLKKSNFNDGLLKACKDCFIGKRIAIVVNFNESSGIKVSFFNSLSFLYETDTEDVNKLTRFVVFYNSVDTTNRREQRYFKKTYWLNSLGKCVFKEEVYDGLGTLVETLSEETVTKLDFIPAIIVRNDGLTGELKGNSELGYLIDYEEYYSKLANADMDAERKIMNPVRYIIDATEGSFDGLSSAPGSLWDIQSDDTKEEISKAQVGLLEANMTYAQALKLTLDRLENAMYSEVDVPNINSEQLQGVITSGKTIGALYWGLSVRCDEKMLSWTPALEFIAKVIIEGGKLYPEISKKYIADRIPDVEYEVAVENNYALPEDEQEEKTMDVTEVTAQTMSRKAYIKKWRGLSDKEADLELEQIMKEKTMFENYGYSYPPLEREPGEDYEDSSEDEPEASKIDQSDLDE